MLTVISHIEFLLRSNDCVVLPGFGAFVANYAPSHVADDGMLIPPMKSIGFNGAVNHGDGLLANSIMRKMRVSYDKACKIISDEVESLRSGLSETGEFSFGRIGMFSVSDGLVVFHPHDGVACYSDYFGLGDVKVKKLANENVADAEANDDDVIFFPISRNIFKIAASIIVICALAFTLTTPISIKDIPDYAAISAIVPVKEKAVENDVVPAEKLPSAATVSHEESSNAKAKSDSTVDDDGNEIAGVVDEPKYYVVVATLRTKKQAERFIEESTLKGHLDIVGGKGGLYRVYAAAGDSYGDAMKAMDDMGIAETNPDAWIYKK